jgi:hypothetical protein
VSPAAPSLRSRPERTGLRDLVPLRAQGPIELVDRATIILRNQWRDLLGLSLVVQLAVWLTLAVVLRDQWARGLGDNAIWFWLAAVPDPIAAFAIAGNAFDASLVSVVLGRALPSLGLAVIGGACGVLVSDWARGVPTTGTQALIRVARRGHRILALWALVHVLEVISGIGVMLGPLLLGIAAPLLFIENGPVLRTIQRSCQLSLRALGRVAVVVVCATLTGSIAAGILGGLPVLIVSGLTLGWTDLGGTATTAFAAAAPHLFLDPMLGLAMALLAVDLRVRFEAVDLTEALDEIADG